MAIDVAIIGAGLSGLACGRELTRRGLSFKIFEASDAVGGRVRTDTVEGFLLDRGFQVLLTAYPEAARVLDYEGLDLKPFLPGARIRIAGRFHEIADPLRRPSAVLGTAIAPIGTLGDKLRVARLQARARRSARDFKRPDVSTRQALEEDGFSPAILRSFFEPFFGGVFFDRDLATSRRMFDYTFRMFAIGDAVLPARGMGAIPEQLARGLPANSVVLGRRVDAIDDEGIVIAGERVAARAVVVATEAPEAERLGASPNVRGRGTVCLYFEADRAPVDEALLVLDGEGKGPVNHLCVPSNVAPTYAPAGAALVSANVVGDAASSDEALERAVRDQLSGWFSAATVRRWRLLSTVRIPYALPRQDTLDPPERPVRTGTLRYVAGDHRDQASIQGALVSGRRAAEACAEDLA